MPVETPQNDGWRKKSRFANREKSRMPLVCRTSLAEKGKCFGQRHQTHVPQNSESGKSQVSEELDELGKPIFCPPWAVCASRGLRLFHNTCKWGPRAERNHLAAHHKGMTVGKGTLSCFHVTAPGVEQKDLAGYQVGQKSFSGRSSTQNDRGNSQCQKRGKGTTSGSYTENQFAKHSICSLELT